MDGHVQHDGFGRDINYLRIAVTDKCNFPDSLNYLFLLKAIVKEGHTNQPN